MFLNIISIATRHKLFNSRGGIAIPTRTRQECIQSNKTLARGDFCSLSLKILDIASNVLASSSSCHPADGFHQHSATNDSYWRSKAESSLSLRHFFPIGLPHKQICMHDRSFGGSNSVIYHSHVGRYRPFSSQISPDQGERLLPESNCAGKLTEKPPTP